MIFAKGFWHWMKPWPWTYLNIVQSKLHVRGTIVDPYRITHFHCSNISGQCVLRTSNRSMHQHGPCHSYYRLDDLLCWLTLMWGASPTKLYLLLILQQLLHKLWGIEDPIISVVSLDPQSMTLSIILKGEFCLDSFSRIYSRLVLDANITTGIVNKNASALKPSQMYFTCSLCGIAYLGPARYSDLQTA